MERVLEELREFRSKKCSTRERNENGVSGGYCDAEKRGNLWESWEKDYKEAYSKNFKMYCPSIPRTPRVNPTWVLNLTRVIGATKELKEIRQLL